jgi:hypothetical protein
MVYKHQFKAPAGLFDGLEIVIYIPYRSDYMVYKHQCKDALGRGWLGTPEGLVEGIGSAWVGYGLDKIGLGSDRFCNGSA